MVVENRAVIEIQSSMCLVEAKGVIPRGLTVRKVFRQKQCHAAPQYYLVLFESTSCKNSDTSCSGSRRKFDEIDQEYMQE